MTKTATARTPSALAGTGDALGTGYRRVRSPYTVERVPKDRAGWLAARKTGIGGSDAAAVAGVSRFRNVMSVYLDKTGAVADHEAGEAAHWGTLLEAIVAQEFADRHDLKVDRPRGMFRSRQHPWMTANLDRIVPLQRIDLDGTVYDAGRAVLEIKTAGIRHLDEWADGQVPPEYYVQVQHYLAVTGFPFAYVAALIGGQRYLEARIDRSEDDIQNLIQIERDFWRLVVDKIPPAPDGSDQTTDYLLSLFPDGDPSKQISVPADLFTRYDDAKAIADDAAERLNLIKNEARQILGEAVRGICGDRKVTWSNVTTERFNAKAFEAAHPDLYAKFLVPSQSRRLMFS